MGRRNEEEMIWFFLQMKLRRIPKEKPREFHDPEKDVIISVLLGRYDLVLFLCFSGIDFVNRKY